jgi:hypothetical protein
MTPQIGQIYYHYKHLTENKLDAVYEIIGIGGNAHGDQYDQKWVIYKPVENTYHLSQFEITCYICPLVEFMETVIINGQEIPRFSLKL